MSFPDGPCPSCDASMQGEPIPEESYGGHTHFGRAIGVEYDHEHPQRYDGISEWSCPDCGYSAGPLDG